MKLDISYQPELVTSKDDTRPNLTHAWIDTATAKLYASDGYMCAVFPVEVEECDVTGYVSVEAIKAARKCAKAAKAAYLQVSCLPDTLAVPGLRACYTRPQIEDVGQFPTVQSIEERMPAYKVAEEDHDRKTKPAVGYHDPETGEQHISFALDVDLLQALIEATRVKPTKTNGAAKKPLAYITIKVESGQAMLSPIQIDPSHKDVVGVRACLMPVRRS